MYQLIVTSFEEGEGSIFHIKRLTVAIVGNINQQISLVLLEKYKKKNDFFILISVFKKVFHIKKENPTEGINIYYVLRGRSKFDNDAFYFAFFYDYIYFFQLGIK